jgi:hypothetical protein
MPRRSSPSKQPSADAPSFHLDPEHVAFVTSDGISCAVAARDPGNQPAVAKVLAVRVQADRCTIEMFVDADRSTTVLHDLRTGSPIALTCSEPGSHRSIQLKGDGASVESATGQDVQFVTAKVDAAVARIAPLGYRQQGLRAYFGFTPAALKKVVFVAAAAFVQTPGPGAGARLGA